jgi:hypothetical protein
MSITLVIEPLPASKEESEPEKSVPGVEDVGRMEKESV